MATRLGICAPYHQHEAVYVALGLADVAMQQGIEVTYLARNSCDRAVSVYWDHRVLTEKTHPFAAWAPRCDWILWLHPPEEEQLRYLKMQGVQSILLFQWDAVVADHGNAVVAMDYVLFPYMCAAIAARHVWRLSEEQTVLMPLDAMLPMGQSAKHNGSTNVYLPLYDSRTKHTTLTIFDTLARVLAQCAHATVTVASGSQWNRAARDAVKRLLRDHAKRVRHVHKPNMLQRLALFGNADITVCPSRQDSLMLVALMSLNLGTPVLTWDMAPQTEFLIHEVNSILVSTGVRTNWLGAPTAIAPCDCFERALVSLLQDVGLLERITAHTTDGLEARRKMFIDAWTYVLEGGGPEL